MESTRDPVIRQADRRSRLVVFGLLWAVLAVGFTVVVVTGRPGASAPDAPAASGPAPVTATATATAAVPGPDAPALPTPVPGTVSNPAGPVPGPRTVTLVAARDEVWVQASVDGVTAHEGVVGYGDRLDFEGDAIDLVVSKPSAVDVAVDGDALPPAPKMHVGT